MSDELWLQPDGSEGLFGSLAPLAAETHIPIEIPVDAGFTLDPEDEQHRGEPLVEDIWHVAQEQPPYEVVLDIDPDGYWGGIPRNWIFSVESKDPLYKPNPVLREIVRPVAEWARGETTGAVADRIRRQLVPQLRKRDRLVVRSEDGDHTLVFEQPTIPTFRR